MVLSLLATEIGKPKYRGCSYIVRYTYRRRGILPHSYYRGEGHEYKTHNVKYVHIIPEVTLLI
jgi:hypothetical protein